MLVGAMKGIGLDIWAVEGMGAVSLVEGGMINGSSRFMRGQRLRGCSADASMRLVREKRGPWSGESSSLLY